MSLANGVFWPAGAASVTRVEDIFVNVRAAPFGAKGDGVTDDTAAFQAAINFIRSTAVPGAILAIPAGIYLITTSLDFTNITSNIQSIIPSEGVGAGSIVVVGAGTGATRIIGNLGAAFPVMDFTGSSYAAVSDLTITGVNTGLQTAAILGARGSNGGGDHLTMRRVNVDGTYAQCPVGTVSADLSSFRDCNTSGSNSPVGFFVGTTDVLGIGSAYQTFASVTGNTIMRWDNVTVQSRSRSGFVLSGGARYNFNNVYIALSGGQHGIELIGGGGQSVNGNVRIESPGTAGSQSVLYVNGTTGPTTGDLKGDWNFNASVDCATIRFGTNQTLVEYLVLGTMSNAGAGTSKFAAGTGTINDSLLWNRSNLPFDATVTVTNCLQWTNNNLHIGSTLFPDGGTLAIKNTVNGDKIFTIGGDGFTGDTLLELFRGGGTTEFFKILAAAGGGSGINNQYTVDRSAGSAAAERTVNFRSSVDTGSTYKTQMQLLPKSSLSLGLTNPGTTATDGFPYIPASAGAPTGVPTAQAGFVPIYYDTTNHKLWIYDSGWKGVVVA